MANENNTLKVGRVFFEPDSGPEIKKVTILTLDSHVENVVTLVNNFQRDFYPAFKQSEKPTRDLLIRAAEKHDDAKPLTFRVTYRSYKENGRKSLGYSFAGHRFKVSDPDRYVELLIRMHHEFSVEGIVKAQAELRTENELADKKFKNFPFDLYILEMCDQIEAELETYAFTNDVQPRVFMDFHSRRREDEDRKIEVSPYPFDREEIPLPLTYYEFDVCEEHRHQISKALKKNNREKGVDFLREMIENAHNKVECQQKEMILCKAH